MVVTILGNTESFKNTNDEVTTAVDIDCKQGMFNQTNG
jgi:hypothetical protein